MNKCPYCGRPVTVSALLAWANTPLVPALFFTLAAGILATRIVVWACCAFAAGILIKGFVIPVVRATGRPHELRSNRY